MKLLIDGFFQGMLQTGSGQYLLHLLEEYQQMGIEEVTVVVPGAANALPKASRGSLRWQTVRPPIGGRLGKVWFEQLLVPRLCRRWGAEVLHTPYFGLGRNPLGRTVVTVHDLVMMVLPQHWGSAAVQLYTRLAARAARSAHRLLADSLWTKSDILRLLHPEPTQVKVVPLGVEPSFFEPAPQEEMGRVRARYGLPERFILYLGGLDWRKNVATLIRAYAHLGEAPPLVVAGALPRPRNPLFPDLAGLVEGLGLAGRVRFPGAIAEEDKRALYQAALAFVFPSLYEGFGLPPLEAMACGVPTICSRATSLPEVVGDAALPVDPSDEVGVAQAMEVMLADPALRRELSERGRERARQFTWRRTAEATLASYREA